MKTSNPPDRRLQALAAALTLNRGEIDAAKLAQLLRLVEGEPTAARS
jgi:hypothetical protein